MEGKEKREDFTLTERTTKKGSALTSTLFISLLYKNWTLREPYFNSKREDFTFTERTFREDSVLVCSLLVWIMIWKEVYREAVVDVPHCVGQREL